MPATLTPPQTKRRRSSGSGLGSHWRVIVLNDSHNTFDGVAEVWSGHRELAELYWHELDSRGLTMAPLESS